MSTHLPSHSPEFQQRIGIVEDQPQCVAIPVPLGVLVLWVNRWQTKDGSGRVDDKQGKEKHRHGHHRGPHNINRRLRLEGAVEAEAEQGQFTKQELRQALHDAQEELALVKVRIWDLLVVTVLRQHFLVREHPHHE